MSKRVKISRAEYNEILESMTWCESRGMGLAKFYRELIEDLRYRGALPDGVGSRASVQEPAEIQAWNRRRAA